MLDSVMFDLRERLAITELAIITRIDRNEKIASEGDLVSLSLLHS